MPEDQWSTRFDSHPLWGALATLKSQLDSVELPTDPQLATAYNRLLRMTATVEAYRDAENGKDLFTNTMLQSVYNAVTQYVSNNLSQYVQDPVTYPPNLMSAAENVDTVYDELAKWPALSLKGRAVAAGQAAAVYADASSRTLKEFEEKAATASRSLAELQVSVDQNAVALQEVSDQSITKLHETVDTEIESLRSQVATLENTIGEHTTRLENVSDTTEVALKETLSEFQEWSRQQAGKDIGAAIRALQDDTDSTVARIDEKLEQSNSLHQEIATLTQETRNIAQSFARGAVAKNYRKNAQNKSVAGWFWDVLGFFAGAIPLGLVLHHFLTATTTTDSITALTLSRIGISAAAVGVAALCFHRGSQNHRESRIAKRTDLRVGTVHTFLANLDPDVAKAVLEGMADQIYLQGRLDDPSEKAGDSDGETNLLKRYIDNVLGRKEKDEYDAASIP